MRKTKQVKPNAHRLYKSEITGRYRKLSDGAMIAIRDSYENTGTNVKELAETYGVSESVIRNICYWSKKG